MRISVLPTLSSLTRRLATDKRGNVLLLSAASLIPLLGILGGALDMARGYLVRTRLQQACDAAVLAGRAMMGNKPWNGTARASADRYFILNFSPTQYGSIGSKISYETLGLSTLHGVASVELPMTIMKMFGFGSFSFQATCDAKVESPNADIMFVLDTTLSMAETNPGDSVSRIASLRTSVLSFYDALERYRATTSRVRYGFVPYASTVNVGMLMKPEWLVDSWTYQSRVAREVERVAKPADPFITVNDGPWNYVSGSKTTKQYPAAAEQCATKTDLKYKQYEENRVNNPDGTASWTLVQIINNIERTANSSNGLCTITEVEYSDYIQKRPQRKIRNPDADTVTYENRYWWDYGPISYSVRALKTANAQGYVSGGEFIAMVDNDHRPRTIRWNKDNACIEERETTPDADPSDPPAGIDLDVDGMPTMDPRTQWRPALPGLIYSRKQWNASEIKDDRWGEPKVVLHTADNFITPSTDAALRSACPTYARKLAEIDASTLRDYVASLKPAGLTYHDVGFLWGLRLLSAQGLFASENQSSAGKVARHLIFMTDGQTETNVADYDAYGLSALDRRRTPPSRLPTASEQNALVERRLAGLCTTAKAKGITVWVIAFGTSLTSLLSKCADDGHAMEAKNSAELDGALADIANRIAQLRLVR